VAAAVIVHLNGRYLPAEEAGVRIDDPGFLFADGVFETALLYRGGFFRLRPHLQRFAASAAMLRIESPAEDELVEIVRTLARENRIRDASIRFTLTRGVTRPTLLVTLKPPDERWAERARAGWRVVTARTRRPSPTSVPAQLKALGRTYALLARHEAADAGADDALLLTDGGHVCEGPTWNVFWRVGQRLHTPALELGVLAGVTRTVVLQLAEAAGLTCVEGAWQRPALDEADEIFATMTSVGLVPLRALDGRPLPVQTPTVDALQPRYWQLVGVEAQDDPA
jgi:branched-subunit amino acid aminotransferase/4-amino-4-deoxychorismate lyase